jgi:hypothetical protein
MKTLKEVKAEIEELESKGELHYPMADSISGRDLLIEQTRLVSKLEAFYWILDEHMPDYECQNHKSSLQQAVTLKRYNQR